MKGFSYVLLALVSGITGWFLHMEFTTSDIIIHQDSVVVVDKGIVAPPIFVEGLKIAVSIPVRTVKAKIDSSNKENKTYKYTDSLIVKNDSTDIKIRATVEVEEKNLAIANYDWDYVIKPITKEAIREIEKYIFKTIEKEVKPPFYKDAWFYSTIATVILLFTALFR